MKNLTLLFILLTTIASCQVVKIDAFKLNNDKVNINFPVVKTGKLVVDSLINTDLRKEYMQTNPFDSSLIEWAIDDGTNSLDYNVTYNQNNILSLNITGQGCGAYCSDWTAYFSYSTKNGKRLDIWDIIDSISGFKSLVHANKDKQYNLEIEELKRILSNDEEEGDYDFAVDYCVDCKNDFTMERFAIYPTYIEIVDNCSFPHVIRALEPSIELGLIDKKESQNLCNTYCV